MIKQQKKIMRNPVIMREPLIPVQRMDVKATLDLLEVGQEEYILFRDAKPATLRTTSARLIGKKFDVSELGLIDRTRIIRTA